MEPAEKRRLEGDMAGRIGLLKKTQCRVIMN
jgi:hypothetical protein